MDQWCVTLSNTLLVIYSPTTSASLVAALSNVLFTVTTCDSAYRVPSDNPNKRGPGDDVETASDHGLMWADVPSK
jgi:hypothetical protein